MGRPEETGLSGGKRPKMLICDIDGTLTDENYTLHPEIPIAFRKMEQSGIPVALATGNVRPVAWTLARHLGITGPIICENGGVVWDWTRDEEVFRLVHGERAKKACEWLANQIRDWILQEFYQMHGENLNGAYIHKKIMKIL